MTNREKIAQMSNKELAEWLDKNIDACDCCAYGFDDEECRKYSDCVSGTVLWLESEVENGTY